MYQTSIFTKPPAPKPPKKRLIRFVLWAAFKRMLMVMGAMLLISVVGGAFLAESILEEIGEKPAALPAKFVLYLPIDDDLPEYTKMAIPYGLGRHEMTMRNLVDALDRAAGDARVKGLVADMQGGFSDIAHIQELRAALLRFRAAGKFAYIYSASYGEPGRGLGTYYLASAFDEIWMQPMGGVSIAGIHAEVPFARAVLDKIGVQPQFFARKEYKTLFESAMNKEMSPQSREMMKELVDDLAGQFTQGIAEARKVDLSRVKALVDRGMYMDKEALDAGLVDHMEDYEALRDKVRMDVTGVPGTDDRLFIGIDDYASQPAAATAAGARRANSEIALVYIQGTIMQNGAGDDFIPADDMADDINDAADDGEIRAIVIRIDSPGGSPTASETIRRAIVRAKSKGKKVVVSMGGMAASGGYWIAAPADRIFASPGTLTGSIGVAGGKIALRGLWDKVGVKWDGVQYGKNADMMSFNEPFSASGEELMNRTMDVVYDGFVARVAEGRKMTPAQVDMVARGRVWSGKQAAANGLVDELGGLDAALDYTAKELGAANRQALNIYILPRPVTPVERIMDLIGDRVGIKDDIKSLLQAYGLARNSGSLAVWEPLTVR